MTYPESYSIILVKVLIHNLINRAIVRFESSLAGPHIGVLSVIIARIVRKKAL